MDDKLLQQVGHFIGQTRAEVLTLTDDKLEKAVELVRSDIIDKHGVVIDYVKELNDKLADDMGDTLNGATTESIDRVEAVKDEVLALTKNDINEAINFVRVEVDGKQQCLVEQFEKAGSELANELSDKLHGATVEHVEQLALMTEQIKAQEIFEAQLTRRIAEIKDGEEGAQGEQGNDGADGLDRPLLEPVELVAQKDYPKSTIGTHDGGLWIATKQTVGSPADDPQAWHCMLNAMTTMSIDLMEDRKFKLSVRMSSGEVIDDTFDIPYPDHKGIWEEGSYVKGDIVTKGHSMWLAQEDTEDQPPGNGWQQILTAPRGRDGKSITGPQGKPGRNGSDAQLPDGFLEELVSIASENKAFEDGREAAYPVTSFRGYFKAGEAYRSGDLLDFAGGLWLCIRSGTYESVAASSGAFEQVYSSMPLGAAKVVLASSDIVGLSVANSITHTFELTETGIALEDPSLIQNIEIVDTAFGTNTGIRYLKNSLSVKAALTFYMTETGNSTECVVSLKRSTFADKDDAGSFIDDSYLAFETSSSNEGTLNLSLSKPIIPANSVVVMTTKKGDSAPVILFEEGITLGYTIPAINVELTGITGV